MDELLQEFPADAAERLDAADLARLEQSPGDPALFASLFRRFPTIKGGGGFLNLSRVGARARGAERLIECLRHGARADAGETAAILAAIDRLSALFAKVLRSGGKPAGADSDVLPALEGRSAFLEGGAAVGASATAPRRPNRRVVAFAAQSTARIAEAARASGVAAVEDKFDRRARIARPARTKPGSA